MLYQLAIYAVSGIGDKTATILYHSTNDVPTVEKIDINEPISNSKKASVILQPINLNKVAELVHRSDKNDLVFYVNGILA
ncbi:hypothetical protein D3C76_1779070 [compost metagenome]